MSLSRSTSEIKISASAADDSQLKAICFERENWKYDLTRNRSDGKPRLSLSQRIVFRLLKQVNNGFILLHDGAETYPFGDVDSDLKVEVRIHNSRAYRRIIQNGSIGAAEAYVEGQWSTTDLTTLIQIFSRNMWALEKHEKRFSWLSRIFGRLLHHVINRNSKAGSRTNIAAHYDLGNDLYRLFLDRHMQYSSAIFPDCGATLEQAQEHKMQLLCERLGLNADDHLLEIGTGWGGLACYAAKHYGCRVTTTTISKAQYEVARQRVVDQGLQTRVSLLFDDYRDLNGQYSKIISVEMIEAVGHTFMPEYFRLLDKLLMPGGKVVIQAITITDQRYDSYRKNVDFIRRYIFPGGHLPSINEICRHLKGQTTMRLNHFSDYGRHYADTLKIWNRRFQAHREEILALGFSEDFIRLWQYYFGYCEGAFREAVIGLAHIEAVKSRHQ